MGKFKRCKGTDDCLALLSYLSKEHPNDQTLNSLSDATHIPKGSLYHILEDAEVGCDRWGNPPMLDMVASRFGFRYETFKGWRNNTNPQRKGMIIDATYIGYEVRDF
jgi:hypothetical protein